MLTRAIQNALLKRLEIVKNLSGSEKTRLTEVIRSKFTGAEAKRLLALAQQLKELSQKIKNQGRQFNQIVNSGLDLVNGTLALFMSATQNITKSYSLSGVFKESFNPQGSRHSGVLKEA